MSNKKFYQQLDVVASVTDENDKQNVVSTKEVEEEEKEACRAYFAAVNRLFIEKVIIGESGVICGLNNTGNTCYFGSGFQAILACSQFLSLLRLISPTMTASVAGAPLVNGMSFSTVSNSAVGTIPYTLPPFPSNQFEATATTSTTSTTTPAPPLPATKRVELASKKQLRDLPVIGDAHTWVNLATKGLFNRPLPGEDPRAPIPAGSEGGVPSNPDQHHFPVWSEFMSLAQQMRFAGNESAISPIVCIGTLSKIHPEFTMMMQHDSSEMVHQLLSSMNDASRVDARSEDLWNIYHQHSNQGSSLSQSFSSSFLGDKIFQFPRIPSLLPSVSPSVDDDVDGAAASLSSSSSTAPVSLASLRALQVLALQNRINLENTAREGVEAERKAGRTLRDGSGNARLLDRFHAAGKGKYVAPKLFNSHLTDPFTGSTLSAITCGSCGSCSRTYESFNTLPLSIPKMITRARYAALHPEYVAMRRNARDYEAGEAKRSREARYEGTAKALGRDPVEFAEYVDDSTTTTKRKSGGGEQGWGSILLTAIPDNTVARAVIASTQLAKIAFSTPPLSWVSNRLKAFPERVQRRFPKRLQGVISGLTTISESAYWWLFVGDEEVPYTDYINNDTGKPYDTSEVDYPLTLDECLRIHFGLPETLKGDNTYRCEVCGVKGTSTKETKLLTTPKYFIVQLMRFGGGGGRKDGTDVVFPMGTADSSDSSRRGYLEMPLDLLPHCATGSEGGHAICLGSGGGGGGGSSSASSSSAQNLLPQDVTPLMPPLRAEYTLASVINHHGSHIDGGHYTACSRRRFVGDTTTNTTTTTTGQQQQLEGLLGEEKRISSEVWLHLDDSVFTQITRADAINTEGYMLVYERDESRPLGSVAMEMALSDEAPEDDGDDVDDDDVTADNNIPQQQKHQQQSLHFYNSDSVQIIRDYFGLDCGFEETVRRAGGGGGGKNNKWINLKRDLRERMLQSTAAEVRAQMIARAMLMDPRMTSGVPTPSSSKATPMFSRGWLATAATTLEPGPVLTHPTTASAKTLSDAGGSNGSLISDPSLRKLWYLAGASQHPYLPLLQFASGVFEEVFTGSSNIA